MITPGSKYFFGLTGLSLISAILYMVLVNPSDLGAIALFGLAGSGALIGAMALFTRDGDVYEGEEAVGASSTGGSPSFWPIVFAFGAALVLTGLATVSAVFILGIAVLIGGGVEWSIQNWADGASADQKFNQFARARAISAIEYPGLAAVGLGVIAFFFSRVVLAVSKESGPIIFIVVATAILVVGVLIATKPSMKGTLTVVVSVLAVLALAGAGTFAALSGERHELAVASAEDHYDASHRECGEEASDHYDHLANNTVSLRSAVTATIFVKDGKVYAEAIGMKTKVDTITIPRSNATSVMFRNLDAEQHRLVVNLGSAKVAATGVVEKVGTCTQLTGENQEQVMTLTIPKPATEAEPYSFTVPGATGEIKLVVP
ncbi:MAG: hypothetical protein F2916_02260 [Actinobacteria bacterium]|jgi:hypothetical protein|uniref:Unannotated protein n=1 Tax=freshwater metagenome TaxID=449393 RepID=A0A6J6VP89_9ZZZZ|nr:hypothetical protein [Actinomycetota bacterium]MSZ60323.1 hypothetical protein [Actinomycetota bacterium]MSZ81427.1 hypothetical protein [Actinomycetota bacterium]MTB12242.1 hypothetical protein [Actinomycetota bacterium]